jgi:hypothetical protein
MTQSNTLGVFSIHDKGDGITITVTAADYPSPIVLLNFASHPTPSDANNAGSYLLQSVSFKVPYDHCSPYQEQLFNKVLKLQHLYPRFQDLLPPLREFLGEN